MNVFGYELRQYRRGLLGWCIGLVVFICVYMPFMPAFLEQGETLRDFFAGLGPQVTAAMGIDVNLFFGSVGFYGFLFTFVSLVGSIQAVSLGLGIISKENRMKTADFLMTKPKSRTGLFLQKLLAALCSLAITEALFYAVTTVAMLAATKGDLPMKPFVLITVTFTLTQLLFLAIGIFVAMALPKIKSPITVSMGISIGFFLLSMVVNLTGSKWLRYFAPLRYFDNNYIMVHGAYETKFLVLSLCVTVVLLGAAYVMYVKKDVKAA